MINVNINSSIALVNIKSGVVLDVETSKTILTDLFLELSYENPNIIPLHSYEQANKDCVVGIGGISNKTHLMPTFNFMGVPSLQCEFTARMKAKEIGFLELSKEHQGILSTFYKGQASTLSSLLRFSTLVVGSIGSRKTNRDMSFELHIEYIPTNQILETLKGHVTIINKDKRNRQRSFGYVLTCRSEVEELIEALGLDEVYLETIESVEGHQERLKLADEYDGELKGYKDKAMLKKVSLASLAA